MGIRIQLRRDTAANWTINNPILLAGECGLETDTGFVKYGDGTTEWKFLPYANRLAHLPDVNISNIQNGQVLAWDTTKSEWGNISSITDHTALSNIGTNTHAQIDLFIASVGEKSGIAPLDENGKVKSDFLPDSIVGQLEYKGVHDCTSGTYPADPETGWYYVVSVKGTISGTSYEVGDWMVFNGTTWDKIDNSQTVSSVNGQTGAVVLKTSDVSEDTNLYFTDDRAQSAVVSMLADTNSVKFTYTEENDDPKLEADVAVNSTTLEVTIDGVGVKSGTFIGVPANLGQGDIIYYDGTTFTRLAAGTEGQVLVTNGAGKNPAWASLDGGDSTG